MDLLGDIGMDDQLTAARGENAVLLQKVKELTVLVHELTMENEALKAEIEIYRSEAAMPTFSALALGKSGSSDEHVMDDDAEAPNRLTHPTTDDFVRSGNGVYPKVCEVTLSNLHGASNPLCVALNSDNSWLATGGADRNVTLCAYGSIFNNEPEQVVQQATRLQCPAPVICVAFAPAHTRNVIAVGCMDGSIQFWFMESPATITRIHHEFKHSKYVRAVAWAPNSSTVATCSADGTVHVFQWSRTIDLSWTVHKLETLHLNNAVESIQFIGNKLICYARNTPHLSVFDLDSEFQLTKIPLNESSAGFEDHVSFAVLDMKGHSHYLALATDASRNIVLDVDSKTIVRNLYGHKNDGYSQPKVAWSASGQYLFGNSQEENSVLVWDIASGQIVDRLESHTSPIRDMVCQNDLLATTSFDKQTKLWFAPTNDAEDSVMETS